MAKANAIDPLQEIKSNLKTNNLIYGTKRALKLLKLNKVGKIYLSKNAPDAIEEDLNYYKKLVEVEVVRLDLPNDELGTFCKKTFPISVIAMLR